eukprot:CAMPEP_0167756360 /NCGR_PEP_ID=MMETSP0110_2-20121227/9344_1 /TAXON_ID=629695 /ORGANISM="Gymnochlora sp., Strain CCMP2014" /LENGTH=557 /DNA_ID=CAMNT_0007642465 /DNA_START=71 /DNA_END=1744 /DNA_ORIENTATION=+
MEAFKKAGAAAFRKKDFTEAAAQFSKAIEVDKKNETLYGNRSVAYLKLGEFEKAAADAEMCITLKPSWAKGYVRKGNALLHSGKSSKQLEAARDAYLEGLKKSPDANTTKQLEAGLRAVQNKISGFQFSKLFDDMWGKLALNPETRAYIEDPLVKAKLEKLQKSPNPLSEPELFQDPKITKCFQVLAGLGNGMNTEPPAEAPKAESKQPEPEPEPEPEPVKELTPEEKKAANVRARADAEKDKGNQLYKKKKLEEALACYESAAKIDPTNCMYWSNKASVLMAQKKNTEAIKTLEEAFKISNSYNASYSDKAKILTKIGKCYSRTGDYKKAMESYQRSLTEDYSDTADRLLRQTKDYMEKLAKKKYVDPSKAEEHMTKGRKLAGEKNWRAAIDEFTEALKRNPKEYKALSNRAYIYSKIMDWNNALADCDKCMRMAPEFTKIYYRKARIEKLLQRYHKALKAVNTGMRVAKEEKDKKEFAVLKQEIMTAASTSPPSQERITEAQKDPDIRNIMSDPIIQQVLQNMKNDPTATRRALSDPGVAEKLEMLIASGILRMG